MPKVWIVFRIGCEREHIIGVAAPTQGSVVSCLCGAGELDDNTICDYEHYFTLEQIYGPDWMDEIAALPNDEFLKLMLDLDYCVEDYDFYGKLP